MSTSIESKFLAIETLVIVLEDLRICFSDYEVIVEIVVKWESLISFNLELVEVANLLTILCPEQLPFPKPLEQFDTTVARV